MNKLHTEWELPLDPKKFKRMTDNLYLTKLSEQEAKKYFVDNRKDFVGIFEDDETIEDYWDDLITYEAD